MATTEVVTVDTLTASGMTATLNVYGTTSRTPPPPSGTVFVACSSTVDKTLASGDSATVPESITDCAAAAAWLTDNGYTGEPATSWSTGSITTQPGGCTLAWNGTAWVVSAPT